MAAPTPARPALRERYERRQTAVIEAAARVFAERGYERTSVSELAAELGIATGAIYHYFAGKEELLIAICDQLMEPLLDGSRELLAAEADPVRRFHGIVRLWVGHVCAHRDHLLVFTQVRHIVDHGDQWRGVRRARKEFERLLDEALTAAQASAGIAIADRGLALHALLGMVNHTVQWYRPRGRLDPGQIAAGYTALVLGPGQS